MATKPEQIYLVTGPMSLVRAAYEELKVIYGHRRPLDVIPATVGMAFTRGLQPWGMHVMQGGDEHFQLPGDWDAFMELVEEWKKPAIPAYVSYQGKAYKVFDIIYDQLDDRYQVYDAYGVEGTLPKKDVYSITEEAFIQSGLVQLAEAGFVEGAKFVSQGSGDTLPIHAIEYVTPDNATYRSGTTAEYVDKIGFAFCVSSKPYQLPVQFGYLVVPTPVTSQGIPYQLDKNKLHLGPHGVFSSKITLNAYMLRNLMSNGLTGIITRAGHLDKNDLELVLGT
jgi:hypothetical protein